GAFSLPLVDGLLRVPALLSGQVLLGLRYHAEELDVAAGEEIEPAIHVDDSLSKLRSLPFHQLLEQTARLGPEPNICAGILSGLVGCVELDALLHGLAGGLALRLGAVALLAVEHLLERLDEVTLGAQQH